MHGRDRHVFTANGDLQAQQVAAFLEAEGIASATRGDSIFSRMQ